MSSKPTRPGGMAARSRLTATLQPTTAAMTNAAVTVSPMDQAGHLERVMTARRIADVQREA